MRRKLGALLLMLAMIGALFTGCYASVERGIMINGDDSFTFQTIVYMTDTTITKEYGSQEQFYKAMQKKFEEEYGKAQLEDFTSVEISQNKNGIAWWGYGYRKDFTLSELQAFFDANTQYGKVNISMSGLIVKEFKLTITSNSKLKDGETNAIAQVLQDGGHDIFTIRAPYSLQEHNGELNTAGSSNEVLWYLNSLDDGSQNSMELKVSYLNMPLILIGAIGLVLVILVLMLVLVIQKRREKNQPVNAIDIMAASMSQKPTEPMSAGKAFVLNEYGKQREEEKAAAEAAAEEAAGEVVQIPISLRYVHREEDEAIRKQAQGGPALAPFDTPNQQSSVQIFKPLNNPDAELQAAEEAAEVAQETEVQEAPIDPPPRRSPFSRRDDQ